MYYLSNVVSEDFDHEPSHDPRGSARCGTRPPAAMVSPARPVRVGRGVELSLRGVEVSLGEPATPPPRLPPLERGR